MLQTLKGDVLSTFSRQNIVQNIVTILVLAAANLIWPVIAHAVSGLSWPWLAPLGVAGFLLASAAVLFQQRERRPAGRPMQSIRSAPPTQALQPPPPRPSRLGPGAIVIRDPSFGGRLKTLLANGETLLHGLEAHSGLTILPLGQSSTTESHRQKAYATAVHKWTEEVVSLLTEDSMELVDYFLGPSNAFSLTFMGQSQALIDMRGRMSRLREIAKDRV